MTFTISQQYSAISTLIVATKRQEKFKQSEIAFLEPKWEAALNSLYWLQQNEKAIKAALSKENASENAPNARHRA